MKRILDDIQSGEFTRDWMLENRVSQTSFRPCAKRGAIGRSAPSCEMMPWISSGRWSISRNSPRSSAPRARRRGR
jgi:ketol-acid reductoisomerase